MTHRTVTMSEEEYLLYCRDKEQRERRELYDSILSVSQADNLIGFLDLLPIHTLIGIVRDLKANNTL